MLMPLASTLPVRSAAIGAGVAGNISQRSAAFAVGADRTRSIVNKRWRIIILLISCALPRKSKALTRDSAPHGFSHGRRNECLRFLAVEDAIDVAVGDPVLIHPVRPIGDQAAVGDKRTVQVE